MEQGILSQIALPLAVIFVMFAMGLALTTADFQRLVTNPKAVGLGLFNQLIIMPIIGILLASIFPMSAILAVSLVLVASVPGGPMSNLIVHVAEGDRALSVSLTALSNFVAFITVPLYVNFAINRFSADADAISLPIVSTMVQIALLTIVPVIIGMTVHSRSPDFAARTRGTFKTVASVIFWIIIILLVVQNWQLIVDNAATLGPVLILLNGIGLTLGYFSAKALTLPTDQQAAIMVETGVQNSTLAITIALTIMNLPDLSIIPGLYGLWMLLTGFAIASWLSRRSGMVVAAA